MSFLSRWRIGPRLVAGFLLIVAATVASGLFALGRLQTVGGLLRAMHDDQLQTVVQISQANLQLLTYDKSLAEYALQTDKGEMDAREGRMGRAAIKLTTALDAYAASELAPEERERLTAFQTAAKAYLEAAEKAKVLAYDGQRAEATEAFSGPVARQSRAAGEALATMLKEHVQEAEAAARAGEDAQRQARAGVAVASGGAALLALVLGLVLSRSISRPLAATAAFSAAVAQGELDRELRVSGRDEIAGLAGSLRSMVAALKAKIAESEASGRAAAEQAQLARSALDEAEAARTAAEEARREGSLHAAEAIEAVSRRLADNAARLAGQIEQASSGAEVQKSRVGETAVSMEEMNATVLEVARNAAQAAQGAEDAIGRARVGADSVRAAVAEIGRVRDQAQTLTTDMAGLAARVNGVSAIMDVISDIADQTNLLALNAAIEAARAGDAGRGFAVVADEVRKLAEKTMRATAEVEQTIRDVLQAAKTNVTAVDAAAEAARVAASQAEGSGAVIAEIVALVEASADQTRSIATASEQQSAASEEIARALEQINAVCLDTAAAMAQASHAVLGLSTQSGELQHVVAELKAQ